MSATREKATCFDHRRFSVFIPFFFPSNASSGEIAKCSVLSPSAWKKKKVLIILIFSVAYNSRYDIKTATSFTLEKAPKDDHDLRLCRVSAAAELARKLLEEEEAEEGKKSWKKWWIVFSYWEGVFCARRLNPRFYFVYILVREIVAIIIADKLEKRVRDAKSFPAHERVSVNGSPCQLLCHGIIHTSMGVIAYSYL